MLLSLIVLASHLNPLGKLGNKIRYLTPDEQKYVINNVQPEGIDISELTETIQNFKQNPLTLEFIHGLFDGDGNISIYFIKPSKTKDLNCANSESQPLDEIKVKDDSQNKVRVIKIYLGYSFTIVQDKYNLSLLNEIKSFFNETGGIYEIASNCSLYKTGSKSALASIILPKMIDKESLNRIDCLSPCELNLPLLKYNKIYYSCQILNLLSSPAWERGAGFTRLTATETNGYKINEKNIDKILELSYYIRDESDNITLEKYLENLKQK